MIRFPLSKIVFASLLLGLLIFSGCLVTKYTLIDPASGKVDKKFIGDWNSPSLDAQGREAGMVIRNLDDKSYYVEWKTKDTTGGVVRAVAQITDVKGATFAQLRGLEADGAISEDWLIVRLDLSGDTLTIRQLSDNFFKDKGIDSSAKLKQTIEGNLDNTAMYNPEEKVVATRKP